MELTKKNFIGKAYYTSNGLKMQETSKNLPFASIIIVNFNGASFLNECLSSVFRTEYPNFEVILVDNASTDKSLSIAQTFASKNDIKIIKNEKNLGFGPANNVGFEHSRGDYIVFLNNDTIVNSNWLSILISTMENDDSIGLAQSLILNIEGKTIQTAGFLKSDFWIHEYSVASGKKLMQSPLPETFEVSTVMGAGMIAKRKFLLRIGLFDPRYFWYYDDEFISFKTWLAGKRVITISGSQIRHIGGGTRKNRNTNVSEFRYLAINNYSLVINIYRQAELIQALYTGLIASLFTSLFQIILYKKPEHMLGNIQACFWFLKNSKYVWTNRLRYWQTAKLSPKALIEKLIKVRTTENRCLIAMSKKYFDSAVKNYNKENQLF